MENSNNTKNVFIVMAAVLLVGGLFWYFAASQSGVAEDENLTPDEDVNKISRDLAGNIVARGTLGAKYTDEYVCADFDIQSEAQTFLDKAGSDASALDVDGNGLACEDLPEVLK